MPIFLCAFVNSDSWTVSDENHWANYHLSSKLD